MTRNDSDRPPGPPDDSELARRLAGLPAESRLPEGAEDRVVDALQREGLLRAPARRSALFADPQRWLWAALVPLAFAAGLWTANVRKEVPTTPSHLLLLHAAEWESSPERTPEDRRATIEEHVAWARRLDGENRLAGAAHIASEGWKIGGPELTVARVDGERAVGVSGYYLIRADSDEEAVDLARGCPHLRRDGVVEVRPVGSSR